MEALAKRLKEIQTHRKLTQKKMAAMIGIMPATLSTYMNNEKSPTLDTVAKMAEAFNVSMGWLCGEDSEENTLRTYKDVLKTIVRIADKTNILFAPRLDYTRDFAEHPYNQPGADVIEYYSGFDHPQLDYCYLETIDKTIISFFDEWRKVRDLFYRGTITEEMYDAIMNMQLDKLKDKPLPDHYAVYHDLDDLQF